MEINDYYDNQKNVKIHMQTHFNLYALLLGLANYVYGFVPIDTCINFFSIFYALSTFLFLDLLTY